MGRKGGKLHQEAVMKLVILTTLVVLLMSTAPGQVYSEEEEEDGQESIKCWKNVYDCINEHSNSTEPRFDPSNALYNVTEAMCCSLIQDAANTDKKCFCEVNILVHQNASLASNVNLLLATCKVTDSLALLDAFCTTANSNVSPSSAPAPSPSPHSSTSKLIVAVVVPTVIVFVVMVVVAGLCFRQKYRISAPHTKLGNVSAEATEGAGAVDDIASIDSLQYEWGTLKAATKNFSDDNKLGQGGFGAVYKGTLPDGQQIAVKRLSNMSRQGEKEFKNEVAVVAKLQHRNLVKLVGFCMDNEEKLLVYEFMLNRSLDCLLFDTRRQKELNWHIRYNIIKGVARGMLYLHEDSLLRIVHRDLKAANVLLDSEMNPRIADFGMAKIFDYNQTHCNTSRIAGTHGYMAPEYLFHGQFSVKSDVYSFGVLVLEIISGRRIIGPPNQSGGRESLLSYAWKCWEDGNALGIIDSTLRDSCLRDEALKCVQLGLLCVEEDFTMRPSMSTVVHILSSNPGGGGGGGDTTLSLPQCPAFIFTHSAY